MAYPAAAVYALYLLESRAHTATPILRFLAEAQGRDLHVITRQDTEPEPLLPWGEETYLVEEAIAADRAEPDPAPVVETPSEASGCLWEAD